MDKILRILHGILFFCAPTLASRVRYTASSLHAQPEVEKSFASTASTSSGFSLFGRSGDDAPEKFVHSLKMGFKAAFTRHNEKRYRDEVSGIVIKTWRGINNALDPVRRSIVPDDGQDLIDRVFKGKIIDKFWGDSQAGGKSGAKLYVLPYDPGTGYGYLLKGEDRQFVKDGVLPILNKYAAHVDPTSPLNIARGACEESTMMKVLMVFEPLNVHKSVNNRVWMLFTNINTMPMMQGNFHVSISYDLKHSREISRCSSDGTDDEGGVGYLGDFLREWEKPLRRAIRETSQQSTLHLQTAPAVDKAGGNGSLLQKSQQSIDMNGTDGGFAGTAFSKTTCLLKALAHDFAVLDSDYPNSKLVDQSALVTMVQLRDDNKRPRPETEAETQIVDKHNNILRVRRDDGTQWHLVIGLIDLFANKREQTWKRFQSHTSNSDYLFDMKKFSLYPLQLNCLMQYMFYYETYDVSDAGLLQSFKVNDGGGLTAYSWQQCYEKGDPFNTEYDHSQLSESAVARTMHTAVAQEYTCSVINTCHAVLVNTQVVPSNLKKCCRNGRYYKEVLGADAASC